MNKDRKNFFSDYNDQIKEAFEDLKTKGRRHKQIPNVLTLMRLTAPCFIIPAAIIGNIPFLIASTAFFGLTDFADGFIARKWNLSSELGKDLDAFADKMFSGTLLLASSFTNPLLLINVALEMAIAGININQKAKGNKPSSTFMGKVKTCFLFALTGAGLLSAVTPAPILLTSLGIATTALQGLTIGSYLSKYKKKNKIKSSQLNVEVEKLKNDEEEKAGIIKKEKTKDKEYEPNTISLEQNNKLEELKQMRDFLLKEQKNEQVEIKKDKTPVLQKTKKN